MARDKDYVARLEKRGESWGSRLILRNGFKLCDLEKSPLILVRKEDAELELIFSTYSGDDHDVELKWVGRLPFRELCTDRLLSIVRVKLGRGTPLNEAVYEAIEPILQAEARLAIGKAPKSQDAYFRLQWRSFLAKGRLPLSDASSFLTVVTRKK